MCLQFHNGHNPNITEWMTMWVTMTIVAHAPVISSSTTLIPAKSKNGRTLWRYCFKPCFLPENGFITTKSDGLIGPVVSPIVGNNHSMYIPKKETWLLNVHTHLRLEYNLRIIYLNTLLYNAPEWTNLLFPQTSFDHSYSNVATSPSDTVVLSPCCH